MFSINSPGDIDAAMDYYKTETNFYEKAEDLIAVLEGIQIV